MKNKKGFTMVELLAVISILAILAALATPLVLTVQKNIKRKMFDTKIKDIIEAAKICAEAKCDVKSPSGTTGCLDCDSVYELCHDGYLKWEKEAGGNASIDGGKIAAINPTNDENMRNCQINFTVLAGVRWEANWMYQSYYKYPDRTGGEWRAISNCQRN